MVPSVAFILLLAGGISFSLTRFEWIGGRFEDLINFLRMIVKKGGIS